MPEQPHARTPDDGHPGTAQGVPGPDRAPEPQLYWRANLRLVFGLLAVWALVSFGLSIVFVEPLNTVRMGGFPLGFWFAQQGSIYCFIGLLVVYAVAADRLAKRHGVD
jgi:putative solute:sodium symporter small subunit